jgi:hypothetical protein
VSIARAGRVATFSDVLEASANGHASRITCSDSLVSTRFFARACANRADRWKIFFADRAPCREAVYRVIAPSIGDVGA